MIRVLHMIGTLEAGGSQNMVMTLYRCMDREQIQFDFVVDHPDRMFYASEIENMGGMIYYAPTFKGTNVKEIIAFWHHFFEEHREYKVLHSHVRSYASVYIPIAKKHGVFTIIHSHSTSNGAGLASIVKSILQFPLRYQADYFMACSETAGKWLFGNKVCEGDRFKVIPNSIDTSLYSFNPKERERVREELNLSDSYVIGHVGRLTKPKNHTFLLKVFEEYAKKYNKAKLLLVGDGDLREEIERQIADLNLCDKVILVGNRKDTYRYYQAMDVFVFPSLWEGLGIVAIEAQTAGLSCVVSDTVPKEIDMECGLVSFLPLDIAETEWVKEIELCREKNSARSGREEFVKAKGYDVLRNGMALTGFYESKYKG